MGEADQNLTGEEEVEEEEGVIEETEMVGPKALCPD